MDASKWFVKYPPRDDARMKLFCFTYSSGAPSSYAHFEKGLQNAVEINALFMPGRAGKAAGEPFKGAVDLSLAIAHAIVAEIKQSNNSKFAFYGHSFGGLLAFLTAVHLRDLEHQLPCVLFAGGKDGPTTLVGEPEYSVSTIQGKICVEKLPQEERKTKGKWIADFAPAEIKQYWMDNFSSHVPKELLADDSFLESLLVPLQMDRGMSEKFDFATDLTDTQRVPLPIPIYGFWGEDDEIVDMENVEQWERSTSAEFEFQHFPGGHFFHHQDQAASDVLDKMYDVLEEFL